MSMSTRRRALCSQPGRAVVWKTPTSARTKSLGSVSARSSPLAMARLTEVTKAVWMRLARAFDQAHRAAGDGVHGGNDELFGGHMVDEEKHPGAERFEWRHGGSEALFGGGKFFDFAAVDGFDEGVTSWEVAIERGVADAGSASDVVKARGSAIAREDLLGYLKDALAVALRVGAGFACRRRWGELLFRHTKCSGKFSATGEYPPVIYYMRGLSPFYSAETQMSIGRDLHG